jgi:hypothetical protein
MELDELKHEWNNNAIRKNTNTDIMKMIQHKSYGPIAELKRSYRKQILMMTLIPFMLVLTNTDNVYGVMRSIMFWSYVAFCVAVISFAYYNYRIVDRMGSSDRLVKDYLEQQITIVQTNLKRTATGIRIALLYFILLAEVLPYFQHYRMLDKWHAVSPVIRFGLYAFLLILQYFVNKRMAERKYGRHLSYLKELAKEML